MIHLFHNWSEWSEEKFGLFHITRHSFYGEVNEYQRELAYQDRKCKGCGKYERRFL